jgi:hypothetical protein
MNDESQVSGLIRLRFLCEYLHLVGVPHGSENLKYSDKNEINHGERRRSSDGELE